MQSKKAGDTTMFSETRATCSVRYNFLCTLREQAHARTTESSLFGLTTIPDRECSFQRVLGVSDYDVSFRKFINRLLPFAAELLHSDPLVQASGGPSHFLRFTSVRVRQLPHCHLHGVPVRGTSRFARGVTTFSSSIQSKSPSP